jgi:hypothetical protein
MALSFKISGDASGAVRDVRQLGEAAEDAGKDLDKLGDKGKKAGKDISKGLGEAKDEARQSGREAAASFSGGFEDVGDFVQETLANALGGFGPAGAAAGIALAAVVGTVLSNAQQAQEVLAESRSRAAELASQMYENGGTLPLTDRVTELFDVLASERSANGPLEKLLDGFVDLGTNIDAVRDSARLAQTPVSNLLRGLAGTDLRATGEALEAINAQIEILGKDTETPLGELANQLTSLEAVRTELEKVIGATELANDLYSSTEFMNTKRVEDLAGAWEEAAVQVTNYFGAGEDGVVRFDANAYIAAFDAQVAAADELKRDLVTLPTSIRAEAEAVWAESGVGAADAYVDAYQSADAGTQARLRGIAGPQGQAAGQAAAEGFIEQANAGINGWVVPKPVATIGLDDSAIRNYKPPTIYVNVVASNPKIYGVTP